MPMTIEARDQQPNAFDVRNSKTREPFACIHGFGAEWRISTVSKDRTRIGQSILFPTRDAAFAAIEQGLVAGVPGKDEL